MTLLNHRSPAQSDALRHATRRVSGVLAILLLLVASTCWAAFQDLGAMRLAVGLGIAAGKIALVAWFFMRLREAHSLVRLAMGMSLVTLGLLFGLSATDYLTRARAPAAYQRPAQLPATLAKPSALPPT